MSEVLWVPFAMGAGLLTETSEALFAAAVRLIILVLRQIIPGLDDLWPGWEWKNLFTFGLSFLLVPLGFWAFECFGGDIPGFAVRCTFEGVVLDALYPGFLAYVLNFAGEHGFKWIEDRARRWDCLRPVYAFLHWLGTVWLYALAGIVAVEFVVAASGASIGLAVAWSILAFVAATGAGILLPSVTHTNRTIGRRMVVWLASIIIKLIIYFLPIPPLAKALANVALTLVILLISNLNFGKTDYGLWRKHDLA